LLASAVAPTRASLGLPDVRGRSPLLAGLAIDSFGGCAGPLLLLYFNRVADIPLGRAGLILSLASVVSLAVPALVGHVIDRVGPRNLVVIAQLAQGAAFAASAWPPGCSCTTTRPGRPTVTNVSGCGTTRGSSR
jgi:MFS family permease